MGKRCELDSGSPKKCLREKQECYLLLLNKTLKMALPLSELKRKTQALFVLKGLLNKLIFNSLVFHFLDILKNFAISGIL